MYRTILDLSTGEEIQVPLTLQEIAALQNTPQPVALPDWDMFYGRLLHPLGDLNGLYSSVKSAAKTSLAFNTDYTNIIEAFKIRTEQALRDCLDELIADGYVVSDEHKLLWNNAIAELNFSDLVKLL